MNRTEKIKVVDDLGFHYEVIVKHDPQFGISIAYYNDDPIARREYGTMREPMGDDDREWEMYEERFDEWASDAITDLEPECKAHFNRQQ